MSNSVLWKKVRNYHQFVNCRNILTQRTRKTMILRYSCRTWHLQSCFQLPSYCTCRRLVASNWACSTHGCTNSTAGPRWRKKRGRRKPSQSQRCNKMQLYMLKSRKHSQFLKRKENKHLVKVAQCEMISSLYAYPKSAILNCYRDILKCL